MNLGRNDQCLLEESIEMCKHLQRMMFLITYLPRHERKFPKTVKFLHSSINQETDCKPVIISFEESTLCMIIISILNDFEII